MATYSKVLMIFWVGNDGNFEGNCFLLKSWRSYKSKKSEILLENFTFANLAQKIGKIKVLSHKICKILQKSDSNNRLAG